MNPKDWVEHGYYYDQESIGQLGSGPYVLSSEAAQKPGGFVLRNGLLVPSDFEPKMSKIGFY